VDEKHKRRICDFDETCSAVEILRAWRDQHERVHETLKIDQREDQTHLQDGIEKVKMNLSVTHMALADELAQVKERLNTVVVIGASAVNTLKALVIVVATAIIAVIFKRAFP